MTIRKELQTVDHLLKDERGEDGSKSAAARAIGVSRQMYAQWEGGFAVPGDEWAEALADYLGVELEVMVLVLYHSRMAQKGAELSAHNPRSGNSLGGVDRPTDNRPPFSKAA